jgi:CubicO group peptidase (beta-lactamase class C family)
MPHTITKQAKQLIHLLLFIIIQTISRGQLQDLERFAIDSFVQKTMNDWHVAGVAVGIVKSDSILLLKGYGSRDLGKKLPFTAQTVFPIASNSKPFTATLVLMAEHERKINLDSPIHKYLRDLAFYKKELTNNVTVKDIICHRSGLPGHDWAWTFNKNYTTKEYFKRIRHFEFSAPLRSKFQYSNFNYIMLSALAESISGLQWDKLLKEKVFGPLEMKNSYAMHSSIPANSELAFSYNYEDSFTLRTTGVADDLKGAISINSTAEDLCHWLQFWLKKGAYKSRQVLNVESIRNAISSHFVADGSLPDETYKDEIFHNIGLGWFLSSYRGHYKVTHGGNIDGFRSEISFFPNDDLGIIVLANQNGSALGKLIPSFISDLLLNLPPRDLHSELLKISKKFKSRRDSGKVRIDSIRYASEPSWNKITGQFYNGGYGKLELKRAGNILTFSLEGTDFALVPKNRNAFSAYYIDDKIGVDAQIGDVLLIGDKNGVIYAVSVPFEAGVSNIIFSRMKK